VRLVKRHSLEQAAGIDVQVARKLWTMTAGDLRHAEDHMLLLGRKSAMERVANFLLEMDRRLAVAGMMALPMCRRDIGDYLGLRWKPFPGHFRSSTARGCLDFRARARSCSATASACAAWTLENGDSTHIGAAFAYRCCGPVVTAYPNGHR
jgi:hypothetical protein